MILLHRLLHRWDNDGPRSLLLGVFRTLRAKVRRQAAPTERPAGAADFVHPFDLENESDTSGFVPGTALATAPLTPANPDFYTTAYYGISPSTLRQALQYILEPLDEFTFVDLGCGKGRALLVAAELPFKALVGIELYENLCETARRNTAREPRIMIQQGDAADALYPDTPLVLFLYHPFLAPVLKRLLSNLERQSLTHPRTIYLLYANPSYPRVLSRFPFLKPVWDYVFPLSEEDAAADRHGITQERFALYRT